MNTNTWNDFNDAEQQQSFDLIPKGTIVKVRMTIKPGGHDDAAQGWLGGYATQSPTTGAVYLATESVVLEGPHARRKMWGNIGLYSSKGPTWGNMGRTFIRALLNSSRNIHPQDNGPQAAAARRIRDFSELDGIEFLAKVEIEKDAKGEDRNVIGQVIEPDHKDYAAHMGGAARTSSAPATASYAPSTPAATARPAVAGKPAWAQ
jgi:hypothetical protein